MIPDFSLREFIGRLTFHKVDFGAGYIEGQSEHGRDEVSDVASANVVSSLRGDRPGTHAVLLDLDVPAWLVPSSTPGHSHLYADVRCSHGDYVAFLRAAERVGLIEPGYLAAVESRGYSSVRLPWIRKENR